jgi:peptidoglycan/LPS O-acetylase OafA/YrhL
LTYFANWARTAGINLGPLGHTWSLAIEEQFYLVWPLALIALLPRLSRKSLVIVAASGAAFACAERTALWYTGASWSRLYYGTDVVAASLLMGAVAAMLAAWYPIGRRAARELAAVGLVVLVMATLLANQHNSSGQKWLATYGWSLIALAAMALVYGAARFGALPWLSWRPLAWLGGISYALYLYHFAVLWAINPEQGSALKLFVGVPVSVVLAWVSTRFVESRFRRRANSGTRRRQQQSKPVVTALEGAPGSR